MIRNIDRIRKMSLEELAPLLIHSTWVSKNFNHNQGHVSLRKVEYFSPSGQKFDTKGDAIADCVKWLDSEWNKNKN